MVCSIWNYVTVKEVSSKMRGYETCKNESFACPVHKLFQVKFKTMLLSLPYQCLLQTRLPLSVPILHYGCSHLQIHIVIPPHL